MPAILAYPSKFPTDAYAHLQYSTTHLFTWAELIRAAICVGKPRHFFTSLPSVTVAYEWQYRALIVRANLWTSTSPYLSKSDAFDFLDPSEKGAISYFIGLTCAKAYAEAFLGVPWLLHIDLFRGVLQFQLAPVGRSRPDLVGLNQAGQWVVMEAKGRSGPLRAEVLANAKLQTRRLRRIQGVYPVLRVAIVSSFERSLTVNIEDPEEADEAAVDIDLSPEQLLETYYHPWNELFSDSTGVISFLPLAGRVYATSYLEEADLTVGMEITHLHSFIRPIRLSQDLSSLEHSPRLSTGPDGSLVALGSAWE